MNFFYKNLILDPNIKYIFFISQEKKFHTVEKKNLCSYCSVKQNDIRIYNYNVLTLFILHNEC